MVLVLVLELVLEQAPTAGGAVKTAELTLPGFRHDLYAMNLSMFAGSPFYAAHKARLVAAGLALVPVSHSFASVFDDGRWLGVEQGLDATCARIAAHNPRDAETWRAMQTGLAPMHRIFSRCSAHRFRPGRWRGCCGPCGAPRAWPDGWRRCAR